MIDISKIDFYVKSCRLSPFDKSFSPFVYLDIELKIRCISKSLHYKPLVDVENSPLYKSLSFTKASPVVVSCKDLLIIHDYLLSHCPGVLSYLFDKHMEKNRVSLFSKMSGLERRYILTLELFNGLASPDLRAIKLLDFDYKRIMSNLGRCKYLKEKDIKDMQYNAVAGTLDTSMFHKRKFYK
jgi:hypothetical protein